MPLLGVCMWRMESLLCIKNTFIERGQSLQNGSYAKNLERNIIAMLSF